MPCDQRQEVTVEFGEATDLKALADALEALGVQAVRIEGKALVFRGGIFRGGEFILNSYESRSFPALDVLKRAYTKATVLEQADRFQWAATAATAVKAAVVGFTRKW